MKRKGNLYQKICDLDNLRLAHKNASKGKGYYYQVKGVNRDLERHLLDIRDMLVNKTYRVSEYNVELINDKGKERELFKLPYYPDRIIQWAIMLQIETILSRNMCYHTCASIKGRGIKRAYQLSKKYTKKEVECRYCLKFDVKKFYPSINKDILKALLRRKFKDRDLLWLLDLIIDSYPHERGLPIGSYLSQFLANYYLSDFDHWLKEVLKLKYVVRYMDDICIYSDNKPHLHEVLNQVRIYLEYKLDLRLKENYQIFPTRVRGVDFVGYRFFGDFVLLRKSIIKNMKRKMRFISKRMPRAAESDHHRSSFYSYLGFLVPANTRRFWGKWCEKLDFMFRWFKGKDPTEFKENLYSKRKRRRRNRVGVSRRQTQVKG